MASVIEYVIEYSSFSSGARKSIRLLEIGAGIGATTRRLLPIVDNKNANKEYHYTDVSTAFLRYGRKKFQQKFGFLEFYKLDINQTLNLQGVEDDYFDIIVATNVLHNAKNIKQLLEEIHSLLSSNGILVLTEGTKINDYSTLVYGLSAAWWGSLDAEIRIAGSPLMSVSQWKALLTATKFDFVLSLHHLLDTETIMDQDILVATKC